MNKNKCIAFAGIARAALAGAVLFAVCAAAQAPKGSPVDRYGRLRVDGKYILSENGKDTVQLRGMSYFWSMAGEASGYYNADVVGWLAGDWKISVIRAAMGINETWGRGYLTGPSAQGGPDPEGNKKRVTDVVDAAIANGIYAIIDWHSHNAHEHPAAAKEFFVEMANKYKDVPNVIYEIFNEPTGSRSTWASQVKPYSEELAAAIRAVDPHGIIILGTPQWCQLVSTAARDPLTGIDNIVYSLHYYSATHKQSFRDSAQIAVDLDIPVFVSEFGVSNSSGGAPPTGSTTQPALDFTEANVWFDFLDERKISWVNWSISRKAEGASAIRSSSPAVSATGNWAANNNTCNGMTPSSCSVNHGDLTCSGNFIRLRLLEDYKKDSIKWAQKPPEVTYTLTYTAGENGKLWWDHGRPIDTLPVVDKVEISVAQGGTGQEVGAVPDEGYEFKEWSDGSTDNPRTDTNVSGDITVTAVFEEIEVSVRHRARAGSKLAPLSLRGRTLTVNPQQQGVAAQVRVINMRGATVARATAAGSANIPLAKIPPGRYIAEVREGGRRHTLSFVLR